MNTATLQEQLAEAAATIRALQDELADTNRGLIALSMELEQRVDERTTELAESNEALLAEIAERKRQEEQTGLLSEVTSQLLATDRPQQIVESLCQKVMAHLDCHVFFNFLVDEQVGRLHLNACAGIPIETAHEIEWLDYGVAVCGCAARDGCRIVSEHIQTTPDPRTDLVRSFGVQAYACHPLLNQGHVIGTLSFGSRTKPAFAEDELRLMKAVADDVALAMQRIRLLESLKRHARAAEAASEAKGRFLANMSHELRTPMNAILGMIDVALPKATDPTVRDCLQTAKGSADLLLTLLDDLLDSARIESGKLELESAPFSLRRMLDQITRVLSVRASERGLCFSYRIPDETLDAVIGDRMRLQQVLLNLAGNAIKFTDRSDVEISLRALSEEGEACLEFAVRDTGIGISPSSQERLFQSFAQADASMARRFGGTGLGLSICKSLVEMMGGCIWVESEVGTGSTFYFTIHLPLAKELPSEFEIPVAVSPVARAQLRILLAEDNPANQKLASYILQDRGHLVEIAGDGQEAVRLTEQNRYDVILMDVQMPGMDGLEATAAIRKREDGGKRVPIIAMTAHAMKGDRDRCLAAGMDGYLSKPIDDHETIALVETLAAGSSSVAAGGVTSAPTLPQAAELPTTPIFDPELVLKRRKAEQRLHVGKARPALAASETDARALVHELQVYQIELEMHNEELQRAQAAAEEASRRYGDRFDFSPVAYFLWDYEGRILEVNLRGAALLGLDRSVVVHKRFGQFVAMEDRARFADFCHRVLATDTKQTCEVKILKDEQAVDALVEGIAAHDRHGQERLCRAAVIDISRQKRADESAPADAGAVSTTSSPTEPTSPPVAVFFDPDLALKRCLNKRDMLQEMIAYFFKDEDRLLPQMRAALQKGDLVEVGHLGHRLKGTLVHLGAEAARESAERVEYLPLHGGGQAEAEEAVRAFERECEVLRAALIEYRATASPMQGG